MKMRRRTVLIAVSLLLLLNACSAGADESRQTDEQKAQVVSTPQLENVTVVCEDFSIRLKEFHMIKSENDIMNDSTNIYEFIDSTSIDSFSLGFDIGFHASNKEVSKRDSFLVLIFDYNPDGIIVSQRDSVIPEMSITATDNKGEKVILLHNSMDEKYIQLDNPIGAIVFKLFEDTESIEFNINGTLYVLYLT